MVMASPASLSTSAKAPWRRVNAAFPTFDDSPTGASPDLQAILRQGWMEALASRLERRRARAASGLSLPQYPLEPLLDLIARPRFNEHRLRWYARVDLWDILRSEVTLGLHLLEGAVGAASEARWAPLLAAQCRRIALVYSELLRRVGDVATGSLKKLLASLAGK